MINEQSRPGQGGLHQLPTPEYHALPPESTAGIAIPLHLRDGSIAAYSYVDAEDADFSLLRWCLHNGYAAHYASLHGRQRMSLLHRDILERMIGILPVGCETDHRDRNRLNNRRDNLRPATHAQNAHNRAAFKLTQGSSQYKGVHWADDRACWVASISSNTKQVHIGRYGREIDAAIAYDTMAQKIYGEFAYLNFPGEVAL